MNNPKRGEGWVVAQLVLFLLIGASWFVGPGVTRLGFVVAALGLGLGVWAGRTMGPSLSAFPRPPRDAELVDRGPYRYLRHPIYVGGVLFFVGLSLVFSVWGLALTAVLDSVLDRKGAARGAPPGRPLPGVRRLPAADALLGTLVPMRQRAWPEAVERVAAFLRERGVEARIEEFDAGTPTAEDAARAVGCKLDQIVKSLVFDCDGKPFVVLVPGDRRADSRKVARAAGCRRAKVAGPEEVEKATGFAPGSVAPFPLPKVERVLVDHQVLVHERVWIGAGSPRHMATLAPADLVRLAKAEPMDAVIAAA